MATEKQIAANRANAQKCAGPTSEKGRAISSMNALKTGLDAKSEIIEAWENQDDRDALTAAWYARFTPANEEECYLLDTAIASEWLQRRYLKVEANVWKAELKSSSSLGVAFDCGSQTFSRIDRRLNSAHRNHSSAMKQLHALRAKRSADPVGETSEPEPVSSDPAAENPKIAVASEQLNPKLDSFRTFPILAPTLPDPVALAPPPSPPPGNIQTDPALSDII